MKERSKRNEKGVTRGIRGKLALPFAYPFEVRVACQQG